MDGTELLLRIGSRLDRDVLPLVYDGGFVLPSETAIDSSNQGMEQYDVRSERERGSTTRTRQRASRRKGASNKPSSRTAPPFIGSSLRSTYENQVEEVRSAYPGARIWSTEGGFWLRTESGLLPGLQRTAEFVTAVPFVSSVMPRSWAFWHGSVWIGPRHTNFPDGSVCSFEPRDNTWKSGHSLVTLLDLHSIWAVRHLHYEKFGRWPGRQAVAHPSERLLEIQPDELCGCDRPTALPYSECCRSRDLARDRVRDTINFILKVARSRSPPGPIAAFLRDTTCVPRFADIVGLNFVSGPR